jgi:hypothetical protein
VLNSTLRQALQRRVDAAGLRPIARQLQLDPSSVLNLLRGGTPRSATRQRLLKWYYRLVREGHEELDKELATEAAAALLSGLPAGTLEEAAAAFIVGLRRIYSERGQPIPGWLEELRIPPR